MSQLSVSNAVVVAIGLGLVGVGIVGIVADIGSDVPTAEAPSSEGPTADIPSSEESPADPPSNGAEPDSAPNESEAESPPNGSEADSAAPPTEEPYVEAVPEPGDPYFEAAATDGSWVSYVNPRDEYRDPYLGEGSGKLCVSLYTANGEVAVGETVPKTAVTVPTGDSIGWHSRADPLVVEFPLTDNYERPLDADQFGTDPDLPQGDGYLDSHCIEVHGMPTDGTVEYGEAEIDGDFEDEVEVVGYIQQAGEAWNTDVDPLADAKAYDEAGGGWTYEPGSSHGQLVVVLQIGHGDSEGPESSTDE